MFWSWQWWNKKCLLCNTLIKFGFDRAVRKIMCSWDKVIISHIWSKSSSVCTQSCLILCDPMGYSVPCSSACGIFQARILKGVAISSCKGSSRPRDWTCISCIGRWILYHWATREAQCILCYGISQTLTTHSSVRWASGPADPSYSILTFHEKPSSLRRLFKCSHPQPHRRINLAQQLWGFLSLKSCLL